jgi:hypothetical protein
MTHSTIIPQQGSLFRSILAVLAGAVAALALIMAVQQICALVYPPPAALDPYDRKAMAAYMATMPASAFLLVLSSYVIGTFGGAWLSAWLARRAPWLHGMIVALLLLLASVANLIMIPAHPLWFVIANLLLVPAAGWLGVKCVPARLAQLGAVQP